MQRPENGEEHGPGQRRERLCQRDGRVLVFQQRIGIGACRQQRKSHDQRIGRIAEPQNAGKRRQCCGQRQPGMAQIGQRHDKSAQPRQSERPRIRLRRNAKRRRNDGDEKQKAEKAQGIKKRRHPAAHQVRLAGSSGRSISRIAMLNA